MQAADVYAAVFYPQSGPPRITTVKVERANLGVYERIQKALVLAAAEFKCSSNSDALRVRYRKTVTPIH